MCRDRMDKQRTFDFHLMSRMNRFVDRVTHLHDSQITMKKVAQILACQVKLHHGKPIESPTETLSNTETLLLQFGNTVTIE